MSKTFRNTLLALSFIYLALGVVLIIWPIESRMAICYVLGAACAVYGVVRIFAYFKDGGALSSMGLALGVSAVVLGLALIFAAKAIIAIFGVIIGVAILTDSILRLQLAFNLKRAGTRGWATVLIFAALMLVLGVVLLFDPFAGAAAATVLTGVSLAVDGILNLVSVIMAAPTLGKIN